MGDWLIRSKENSKEYKNSRYRQQSPSLGLRQSPQGRNKHRRGPYPRGCNPELLAHRMVFSEAAELPGENVRDVVHEGCRANSPHPETILWGEAGGCPQGVLCLRTQGVLGEVVHGRGQACGTGSEAFPEVQGKPLMRSTTSGALLQSLLKPCLLPWVKSLAPQESHVSQRNPFLLQCPSRALYWRSLTLCQQAKDQCLQVQLHYHRADKKKGRMGAERQ